MKKFIQKAIEKDNTIHQEYESLEILLNEYNNVIVYRERKNIDILVVSESNKFVLVIENKIWSRESAHQLKKYEKIVNEEYPSYSKLYIFLTPEGQEAINSSAWINLRYENVIEILNSIIKLREDKIEDSIKKFIEVSLICRLIL